MEKSQDCGEVCKATKSGQHFPESFTVDGVESLSQINERYVEIHVLFLAFLLNLPSHKYHVRGSSKCSEATLAFR